ncbi:MAG: hypothetical protein Q8K52_10560 [Thiobacillus sp.]|nr:hypothetical protein [Thiobacillus sp.]
MAQSKTPPGNRNDSSFILEGRIQREQAELEPDSMALSVFAFDQAGTSLGSAPLDEKGNYRMQVRLTQPTDVVVLVGPSGDPQQIRHSSAHKSTLPAESWKGQGSQYQLRYDANLPLAILRPWWPQRICISGHVRKVSHHDGHTEICPVPFVKVEIFDVDREFCLWPILRKRWPELLDRPVIRIPELLEEPRFPPRPFPGPDPAPDLDLNAVAATSNLDRVSLNPQPLPPRMAGMSRVGSEVSFNPQPDPPLRAISAFDVSRVGESRLMDNAIATRLDKLTLSSKIPPWLVFPHCFYSKAEVCETTTDCSGYFNCCFNWYPFHFRHGRLRFDGRPDIIVKLTQIINGVPTVIYLDPYTSTRWNTSHAHIDLFLDNETVRCGSHCNPQPEGAATFLTLVGLDEVYKINQTSGKFGNLAFGGTFNNWAYGGSLLVSGVFGDALTSGAPKRYYRLSYKSGLANADPNDNTGFIPIDYPLTDTRVNKITFDSEVVTIGPQPPVNGVSGLYEIRNTANYYWYKRDQLGWLTTEALGLADGLYTVRLEVFDETGTKLTSAAVDYRDGTDAPPGPLPPMVNRCDLVVLVDNKAPTLGLTVPGASGTCGVVPFSAIPGLSVDIQVNQPHGRLHSWGLSYVKGITGGSGNLGGNTQNSGIVPLPVAASIPATPMTAGLTGTCSFALTLNAWPLVRNGFGAINHVTRTIAIAIEKCSP